MEVTCPNCGSRYAVDPLAIGPAGRTVQCARCDHRWRERPHRSPTRVPAVPPRPSVPARHPPPTYNSGLPALTTPPARSHWGLWQSVAAAGRCRAGRSPPTSSAARSWCHCRPNGSDLLRDRRLARASSGNRRRSELALRPLDSKRALHARPPHRLDPLLRRRDRHARRRDGGRARRQAAGRHAGRLGAEGQLRVRRRPDPRAEPCRRRLVDGFPDAVQLRHRHPDHGRVASCATSSTTCAGATCCWSTTSWNWASR